MRRDMMDFANCRRGERRAGSGLLGAAVLLAAIAVAPYAYAQDYPARAVKIIVPFPAGGSADVIPRIVGDWLSHKWGQPVVVKNRPGAAGRIGAAHACKPGRAGHTL